MYLIVGIDPGTTIGVSFLDLKGNLLALQSKKSVSYNEVIKMITKQGQPVIISCDVTKVPSFVSKISSKFNAFLFVPDHNLKVMEKKKLIREFFKEFYFKIKGKHERDALASAINAYTYFLHLFRKVERTVRADKVEEVKKKVILREAHTITAALKK